MLNRPNIRWSYCLWGPAALRSSTNKTWQPTPAEPRRNMDKQQDIELHQKPKGIEGFLRKVYLQGSMRRLQIYSIRGNGRLVGARCLMSICSKISGIELEQGLDHVEDPTITRKHEEIVRMRKK